MTSINLPNDIDDSLPHPDAPVGVNGWLLVPLVWLFIMMLALGISFRGYYVRIIIINHIYITVASCYSQLLPPVISIIFSILSRKAVAIRGLIFALFWIWFFEMIWLLYAIKTYIGSDTPSTLMKPLIIHSFSTLDIKTLLLVIVISIVTILLTFYLVLSKRVQNTYRY